MLTGVPCPACVLPRFTDSATLINTFTQSRTETRKDDDFVAVLLEDSCVYATVEQSENMQSRVCLQDLLRLPAISDTGSSLGGKAKDSPYRSTSGLSDSAFSSSFGHGGAEGGSVNENRPIGLTITNYHILLAYPRHLVAVNRKSKAKVVEQTCIEAGNPTFIGMAADEARISSVRGALATGAIVMYTKHAVFLVESDSEAQNEWRILLDLAKSSGDKKADDKALYKAAARACPVR